MGLPLSRLVHAITGAAVWRSPLNEVNLGAYWDSRDLVDGAVTNWTSRDTLGQIATQSSAGSKPTKGATGVVFDGGDTLVRSTYPVAFVSGTTLPDGASNATAGKGWTCTGLARATDGTWWIANHGKALPADPTYAASLVHVSADFATILGQILLVPLGVLGTVQGVAWDKSDGTLWFVDGAAKKVRHITTAGVAVGDEITLTYVPNGVARDHTGDRLFITAEPSEASPNTIEIRSCVDGSLIASPTTSVSEKDHLYYDDTTRVLYMSSGANGAAGTISALSASNNAFLGMGSFTLTSEADAIEGLYVDGKDLYVMNDGYFHTGTPALNRMLKFRVPIMVSNVMDLFGIFIVPTTTGTDALMDFGDPISAATVGYGLYSASNTNITVYAHSGGSTTTTQVVASATSPALTSARIVYARITLGGNVDIWIDGTLALSASAAALVGALSAIKELRFCSTTADTRFATATAKVQGYVMGQGDRQRLEGYMAHAFSLAGNLPSDHPYKNAPP